jgi:hypothetical protein
MPARPSTPVNPLGVSHRKLDFMKFGTMHSFSRAELQRLPALGNGSWAIEQMEEFVSERLTYQLTGYILSRPVKDLKFEYPRDWWEAVKERFAPAWVLKRWPVQRTTHVVKVRDLYPEANFAIPRGKFGDPYRWVEVDNLPRLR